MANDLTFNQISSILNEIMREATGQRDARRAVNTAEFVSQAQTLLKIGYDPLTTAISQVLARTIFSVRPYSEHFKGLRVSNQKYGNHIRKLTSLDRFFDDSTVYSLTDNNAVDQFKVKKPKVLQTNFYGEEVYQDHITIYTVQLDSAMQGPEQFAEFITMITQHMTDRMTQARENLARMTLSNMIGATATANTDSVIHLVTEYNAYTGKSLDSTTVKAPENYNDFIKWAYARIKNVSDLMTERSTLFHVFPANEVGESYKLMRHTPYNRQKMYLSSFDMRQVDSRVLSSVFNDERLSLMDYETVNFWQNIKFPDSITVTPSYLDVTDGEAKVGAEITVANIFGVLFDEEAVGYTITDESVERTPYNAMGKYFNQVYSDCKKYWNDMTENFVVFLMD